jgi:exopolysaccharide biosynthesis polyprenyl glycosylphosphotransferase
VADYGQQGGAVDMYKKKSEGWLKHSDFILLDMILLQMAFILAYNLRFGLSNPYQAEEYFNLAFVYLLVDFFIAIAFDSFKNVLKRGMYQEFLAVIRHVLLVEGTTVFYLFSTKRSELYSRLSFYLMIPLYIALTYIGRLLWKRRFREGRFSGANRSLLIIATEESLPGCVAHIQSAGYNRYSAVGAVVVDADRRGQVVAGVPIVADYRNVVDYVCLEWVDEVFLSLDFPKEYEAELIETLTQMGVAVHIAITSADHLTSNRQQLERLGDYTVLTTSVRFASPAELTLKRAMDIAGGLVGCLITLVLLVFVGPAIYLSSPGPVFFAQERVGRNGKHFKMYKFRTMYLDAEERKAELIKHNRVGNGMMFKLDYDPRIIGNKLLPDGTVKEGLGSFLRRTSLDEFPQFFNILKGDMSLVGPRPERPFFVEKFKEEIPRYMIKHQVRPGLTGWAQVNGYRGDTSIIKRIEHDLYYIENWTMGFDFKIMFLTVFKGFINKNAY